MKPSLAPGQGFGAPWMVTAPNAAHSPSSAAFAGGTEAAASPFWHLHLAKGCFGEALKVKLGSHQRLPHCPLGRSIK